MDLLKKGNKAHLTTQYKYARFHSGVQNVSEGNPHPSADSLSPGPPKNASRSYFIPPCPPKQQNMKRKYRANIHKTVAILSKNTFECIRFFKMSLQETFLTGK